ncbi:DNA-binding MarR family transcriptional regulator [Streptomyces sp. B4I13]|uniref:MarR family winged helix-turn-helix transcriptional regulator n=1 Tax=Streptomyces sp. B4I13 TaxID=3042271 RepID=UPI00278BA3A6|nr:MarR family transcriptional regulator [Streptomyces sp. B4I13]MDQ0964044.1 DNA-binding MarR family transcriptional regulator [Streptomyces sp. B4I13]
MTAGYADSSDDGRWTNRGRQARRVADAVESLVACWLAAAEEASPRLPARQLHALRTVRGRPELNLTALAEHLGVGLPTASRLCDRLEAAGLLERTAQPHSRREVRLVLTAYGHRVLADVAERRVRRLTPVFEAMTPAQCAALEHGLSAFHQARTATDSPASGQGPAASDG